MAARADYFEVVDPHCLPTPAELEQRRLDRLLELRGVIQSLRNEQAGEDPLLSWAIELESPGSP